MDIEAILREQVAKAIGSKAAAGKLERLAGHASNRSYYRTGDHPESGGWMVMPQHLSRQSEEASREEMVAELPFLNVQRYLSQLAVRVPRIFHYDEAAGVLVMEDLGDLTFEKALQIDRGGDLYEQAIDLLAYLRASSERNPDPNCVAFRRNFDTEH